MKSTKKSCRSKCIVNFVEYCIDDGVFPFTVLAGFLLVIVSESLLTLVNVVFTLTVLRLGYVEYHRAFTEDSSVSIVSPEEEIDCYEKQTDG